MKNLVPVEEYNKLKLHLKSIANRHQAFSKMIFNGDANFNSNTTHSTNQLMGHFKSVPDMTGLNYDEPKDQFMPGVFKTEQLIIDTGDKSHLNENKNAFISPIENSHKTNPLVSQSSFLNTLSMDFKSHFSVFLFNFFFEKNYEKKINKANFLNFIFYKKF